MNLFSENDYRAVSKALSSMEEITVTRILGGTELSVCVKEASKAWPVGMVVQASFKRGRMERVQTFESIEEVKRALGQVSFQSASKS